MRTIDKFLEQVEQCIQTDTYTPVETEKIELKDLSSGGDWKELYKTVCAFLNTGGGIVVVGIKEDTKQKRFRFTGYDANNEDKIKQLPQQFTNDKGESLNLTNYVRPDWIEIKPFATGQVCLVFVEKLPDEEKYVFYNNEAYERRMTGDHKVDREKIRKQQELKEELRSAIELSLVPNVTLNDLDVEKLNDFIIRLNTGKKVETVKADIQAAIPFLSRKRMIRDGNPTLLGMLVCGKYIEDYMGGKCELDAYFETGRVFADDRKVYKDNIIPLMESGWNYTFSKTGTGISIEKGGSAIYEYPREIIRETINNALAHRDYTSGRFSILRVRNNEYIEIRNPGKFRQEQLLREENPIRLRRIIPLPKARNPHLADILKVYNRWEGKGIGLASLTAFALNNEIDVPYYRIYPGDEIGLYIPKGKTLDEHCEGWLNSFNKYILTKTNGVRLTSEQKSVLSYFYKCESLNESERFTINLTPDNNHFDAIRDLERWGLVYQLPQTTTELQVYGIDPVLKKKEFHTELREIYGNAYDTLNNESKEILGAIYQHNEYGATAEVSANLISNYLYFKKNSSLNIDINRLDNFKRKIRTLINRLEKEAYIQRKREGKPDYEMNKKFTAR
jgi:predicted HTH transcriptional regulator